MSRIDQVLAAAGVLFQPGDVIEVRVPKAGKERTVAGFFSDIERLAGTVAQLEQRKYPGIYWTLNPVLPDLASRAGMGNKVKPYVGTDESAKDEHIVRRRWFPVDLDPVRPSGISATDVQKAAALELAERMRVELHVDGWPEPVFADSGNGYHLLYRIDLPNDPLVKDMLSRALQALGARFDVPGVVEVDNTLFNASRICKIYGTTARKGDHSEDRPHRLSQLLYVPEPVDLLSHDQLRVLASTAPVKTVVHQPHGAGQRQFSVEEFLSKHGIRHRPPASWEGGLKWVLEACPFDPSHKAPDSAVFEGGAGALAFRCLHNSCADNRWQQLREKFEGPKRPYIVSPGRGSLARAPEPVPVDAPLVDEPGQKLADRAQAGGEGGTGNESHAEPPDLTDPQYPLTDSGNGERVIAMFGKTVHYCVEMKSWFIWDGRRWKVDHENLMRGRANEMARLLYYQAAKMPEGLRRTALEKHARTSESSKGITNALIEAQRMRGVPVTAQKLDQHPDHLNFLNGTVDLRDGSIRPHDPEMLITKLIEYPFNPAAKAPRLQSFIEWAMGGNSESDLTENAIRLIGFVQRVIGYSITGDVSEKAVFVFYGQDGNNGKTTLLTLFRELLGRDYASLLLIETIMHARSTDNTAREDMADLRGTRFVQTSEVGKEDRLNEQRIKFLTQGMGTIKSRRLHEHLVEFQATHKLLMDCNYRPKVSGQDNAIWRRLKQVPFLVTISDEEKDLALPDKLKAEAEGALAWAVRGAIEWYKHGLGDPPEVTEAQSDWREHDDPLKEFLGDWCELGEKLFCPVSDLMSAYLLWAKEYGEKFPMARRSFNEALTGKGVKQDRKRIDGEITRIWLGVELKIFATQKLRRGSDLKFSD